MHYHANGKILLTSEYFILDGAKGIALPTNRGQTMDIKTCESPHLKWDAYHNNDTPWISTIFDLKNFDVVSGDAPLLQKLLQCARDMNPTFLKSESGLHVTTRLEFPHDWGLGSSSTLIYLISQWAGVYPFALLDKIMGGSGYDIACADSQSPILYWRDKGNPTKKAIIFNPIFKNNLYFIHLNQKQDTRAGISHYKNLAIDKGDIIQHLNDLSEKILQANALDDFEKLLNAHENIIGDSINMMPIQQKYFADYWGQIKSLGAWGGDFIMATSNRDAQETFAYFQSRGYNTILKYDDLILP